MTINPNIPHLLRDVKWDFQTTIHGQPASSKNNRRIVKIGDTSRLIKSKKALDYEKLFHSQCLRLDPLLEGDVALEIDVWYASRRPDLACADLIQDLLQGHAYSNDRQVKSVWCRWNLSKDQPRAEIYVRRIEGDTANGVSHLTLSQICGIKDTLC
jgi:Holliday junction resolvase RusA-like endonuclease